MSWLDRKPLVDRFNWLLGTSLVPVLLGSVLLVAALFKGYELTTEELSGKGPFTSRSFLTLLVVYELGLGTWLLSSFHPALTRWLTLLTFVAFLEAGLYLALTKQPGLAQWADASSRFRVRR